MNKGILSLAIAVPTVLFTTLPSLADVVKTPVNTVTPQILVKPGAKTGIPVLEVDKIQAIGAGGNNEAPGVAPTPRPPRGPIPPRRDGELLLRQIGNINAPNVNIIAPIKNINAAPVGY